MYNAGNELNSNTGWYEMFFRGYDPALGRMLQVDPYATMYSSYTTYNYGNNNPIAFNDPTGGKSEFLPGMNYNAWRRSQYNRWDASYADWNEDFFGNVGGSRSPKIFSPWAGAFSHTNEEGDVFKGAWMDLYSEEAMALYNNKYGVDSDVLIDWGASDVLDQANVSRFTPEMFQFEKLGESNWQAAGITHATIGFIAGLRPVGVVFQLEVGAPIRNRVGQYYSPRLLSILAAQAANEAAEKLVKNKKLFYNPMSNAIIPPMFAKDMQTILNRKLMSHNLVGGGARVNTPIISNIDNIIDFLDYIK